MMIPVPEIVRTEKGEKLFFGKEREREREREREKKIKGRKKRERSHLEKLKHASIETFILSLSLSLIFTLETKLH